METVSKVAEKVGDFKLVRKMCLLTGWYKGVYEVLQHSSFWGFIYQWSQIKAVERRMILWKIRNKSAQFREYISTQHKIMLFSSCTRDVPSPATTLVLEGIQHPGSCHQHWCTRYRGYARHLGRDCSSRITLLFFPFLHLSKTFELRVV